MKSLFNFKILLILIISTVFLSACSQKAVRVIDKKNRVYNKKNINSNKYQQQKTPKSKEITVKQGETLYSIAREHNIPANEIAKYNKLSEPFNLKKGDLLTIPASLFHEVKEGETLYSISKNYNKKAEEIAQLNKLSIPYFVKKGDKIKIISDSSEIKNTKEENYPKPQPEIVKNSNNEKNIETIKNNEPINTANNYQAENNQKINLEPETKEQAIKKAEQEVIADKSNSFIWPVKGKIISKFGPKDGGLFNDGINIKAKDGDFVLSTEDGVVAYVGNELKGYGNLIILKHAGGWISAYGHLKKTNVTKGERVKKSHKIALIGSSGKVNSSQLYFSLRKGRDAVNPENYLNKNN
jgi:murein DD-endopeptidase MepM/ murein hydrolase activator NlpD